MANTINLKEKKEKIEELQQRFEDASIVIFTHYRGLTVSELTGIRKDIRPEGGQLSVVKNTFSRRALKNLSVDADEALVGPTAVITTSGDPSKLSKLISKAAKSSENFEITGGFFENKVVDKKTINNLANLPSREELIAKVVGGIKSPLTGLVGSLSSPIRGIIGVLNSIKNEKENN